MLLFEFMLILPILFYWINKSYEALINTILLPKTNWLSKGAKNLKVLQASNQSFIQDSQPPSIQLLQIPSV